MLFLQESGDCANEGLGTRPHYRQEGLTTSSCHRQEGLSNFSAQAGSRKDYFLCHWYIGLTASPHLKHGGLRDFSSQEGRAGCFSSFWAEQEFYGEE